MTYLAVLIPLLAIVVVCNSQCFSRPPITQATGSGSTIHCEHNELVLSVGSKFTEGCTSCSCQKTGLFCCNNNIYISHVPDHCKVIRDGCRQTAVMKNNPSEPCDGPISAVS
ncbi:hypothetical protein ScPMuIL_010487 [Solemya velum]